MPSHNNTGLASGAVEPDPPTGFNARSMFANCQSTRTDALARRKSPATAVSSCKRTLSIYGALHSHRFRTLRFFFRFTLISTTGYPCKDHVIPRLSPLLDLPESSRPLSLSSFRFSISCESTATTYSVMHEMGDVQCSAAFPFRAQLVILTLGKSCRLSRAHCRVGAGSKVSMPLTPH